MYVTCLGNEPDDDDDESNAIMQREDRIERIFANPKLGEIRRAPNAWSCVQSLRRATCVWNRTTSLLPGTSVTRRKGRVTAAQPRRRRRPRLGRRDLLRSPRPGSGPPTYACLPPMQEPTNLPACLLFLLSHVRLPAHGNTGSSLAGPGEAVSSPGVPTS